MSIKVANQLGLKPTRMQPGFGAGGQHSNPIFFAGFTLPISDGTRQSTLSWEQEVLGIPDLDKFRQPVYQGKPMELIGLLGRDLLAFCRIVYDGLEGRVEFSFDLGALQAAPSR